jgi:DNA-binding NarL/FixJ family response regulator
MNNQKIRLLIADDHELFVRGLIYIIENLADDVEVVGSAADGREALEFAKNHSIDIVLMDVRMPEMDGVEATKLFRLLHENVHIIMLTTFDDDDYVHRAIQQGAAGYLLKSIRPEDLLTAIRAVMSGQILFDGKLSSVPGKENTPEDENTAIIRELTPRERDVLRLMLESYGNRQIGEKLGISDHSVRNYVSAIYLAFNVNDRFELLQKLKFQDFSLHF